MVTFYLQQTPIMLLCGLILVTTWLFKVKLLSVVDLQVDGTQTIINSTTMTVDDKTIVLADGAADSAAATGSGIEVSTAGRKYSMECWYR